MTFEFDKVEEVDDLQKQLSGKEGLECRLELVEKMTDI